MKSSQVESSAARELLFPCLTAYNRRRIKETRFALEGHQVYERPSAQAEERHDSAFGGSGRAAQGSGAMHRLHVAQMEWIAACFSHLVVSLLPVMVSRKSHLEATRG